MKYYKVGRTLLTKVSEQFCGTIYTVVCPEFLLTLAIGLGLGGLLLLIPGPHNFDEYLLLQHHITPEPCS
jgi:hypothetical protein